MVERGRAGYDRVMDKNLVQNEGVNAGSAEQIEDSGAAGTPDVGVSPQNRVELDTDDSTPKDVRGGGDPQRVAPVAPVDDLDPRENTDDAGLLGSTDEPADGSGQRDGTSGQDAGSME